MKTYLDMNEILRHCRRYIGQEYDEPYLVSAVPEEVIRSLPPADVVEVVRCGQCKHCVEHYDTDGNAPYWTCKEWDSGTDYDGYCHYGERKDGGRDE